MNTRTDCIAWDTHLVLNADHFTWDCPVLDIPVTRMRRVWAEAREWEAQQRDTPRWDAFACLTPAVKR